MHESPRRKSLQRVVRQREDLQRRGLHRGEAGDGVIPQQQFSQSGKVLDGTEGETRDSVRGEVERERCAEAAVEASCLHVLEDSFAKDQRSEGDVLENVFGQGREFQVPLHADGIEFGIGEVSTKDRIKVFFIYVLATDVGPQVILFEANTRPYVFAYWTGRYVRNYSIISTCWRLYRNITGSNCPPGVNTFLLKLHHYVYHVLGCKVC